VILRFKFAMILIVVKDAQEDHHVDMLILMVLEKRKEEVMIEEFIVIAKTEKIVELLTAMTVVDLLPLVYAMPFKKVSVIEVVHADTLMMVVQVIVVVTWVQIMAMLLLEVTFNAMLLLEVNVHVVIPADSNIPIN